MKNLYLLLMLLFAFFTVRTSHAQSSFPPKRYPSSIKVLTDAGVAQYWDVKRIMCVGKANGGYKFRIYGRANADHRSQSVNMYYILPGNVLKTAGAYQFPEVKEGQSFNFEIVSAFIGHAPAKFDGFMIMDEWLKAPQEDASRKTADIKRRAQTVVPDMPEEMKKSIENSRSLNIHEFMEGVVSDYESNREWTVDDFDTDPIPKEKEKREEEICTAVDVNPEFTGGMTALSRWLGTHVDYPKNAYSLSIQGRVLVRFVVEKDGSISNVSIAKSVDKDLDKEAMRVVKSMPRWNPGRKNGVPVRTYFNIPINFKLQN
ncbi:MAG: energy transducer TonB [Bacteroidales bacterium]|nr:energy transducer TonB [Bacteroidales bacterium]